MSGRKGDSVTHPVHVRLLRRARAIGGERSGGDLSTRADFVPPCGPPFLPTAIPSFIVHKVAK